MAFFLLCSLNVIICSGWGIYLYNLYTVATHLTKTDSGRHTTIWTGWIILEIKYFYWLHRLLHLFPSQFYVNRPNLNLHHKQGMGYNMTFAQSCSCCPPKVHQINLYCMQIFSWLPLKITERNNIQI